MGWWECLLKGARILINLNLHKNHFWENLNFSGNSWELLRTSRFPSKLSRKDSPLCFQCENWNHNSKEKFSASKFSRFRYAYQKFQLENFGAKQWCKNPHFLVEISLEILRHSWIIYKAVFPRMSSRTREWLRLSLCWDVSWQWWNFYGVLSHNGVVA